MSKAQHTYSTALIDKALWTESRIQIPVPDRPSQVAADPTELEWPIGI